MSRYNAVVVGSGPNGLAAAITLRQAGLEVLLLEGAEQFGGGMRSAELTVPGFIHDICSTVHPLALGSSFFDRLPLSEFGLEFLHAPIPLAHPLDDGPAVALHQDITLMEESIGKDAPVYRDLFSSWIKHWPELSHDILAPIHFPKSPLKLLRETRNLLQSAQRTAQRFQLPATKALWLGLCAHGMLPLHKAGTSAIGLVLGTLAHRSGWPIVAGGSANLTNAMLDYYRSLGGKLEAGCWVKDIRELPSSEALFFDLTPKGLLAISGLNFSANYRRALQQFRYGMGVFKIDWALSEPIPFRDQSCRQALTIHLGGLSEEIADSERLSSRGEFTNRPYVILVQPSLVDPSRAPKGKHIAWAYCHVPHGAIDDYTQVIEAQVERFAPGFKDVILARSTKNAAQMEAYNPNYVGGDINGGMMDLTQLYTRPVRSLVPYRTDQKGVYLCSSSTPPGGGVHGLCGFHAARIALADLYHLKIQN